MNSGPRAPEPAFPPPLEPQEPTRGCPRCRVGVPDRQRHDVQQGKSSGSLEQGGEHRV